MYRNLTSVMLYHLYFSSVVYVKLVSLATTMYGLYLDWLVYTSMYAFTAMTDVMRCFYVTCLVLPNIISSSVFSSNPVTEIPFCYPPGCMVVLVAVVGDVVVVGPMV
jgi:hypothetical protein